MARQFDVDDFLEREIYSRVPESLDRMLPEFGWTRKRNHWEATNKITTRDQFSARADRVTVYDNRPHWVVVQGGQGRRLLDLAAGGVRPRGDDFWTAVRKLADAVGVAVPSRSETPAAAAIRQERELSEDRMEAFYRWAAEELEANNPKAEKARDYLVERGLGVEARRTLGVGLYADHEAAKRAVEAAGGGWDDKNRWLTGYLVFPWRDPRGRAATAWCRYVGEPPDNMPKFRGLSGATKPAPLYLDRAASARVRELVLVEGILDAAVAQVMGDPRVVAVAGTSFGANPEWAKAIKAMNPKRVIACLDPDAAGDRGLPKMLEDLHTVGLEAWAAPCLPVGVDVDDYLREHGLETWNEYVAKSQPGLVRLAEADLAAITPEADTMAKSAAVERVRDRVRDMAKPGSTASLYADDVARLVAARTGYDPETIGGVLARAEATGAERKLAAEAKRVADQLARELKDAKRPAAEIVLEYRERLDRMRPPEDNRPPPFSVDRILELTRNAPPPKLTGWRTLDNDLEFRFVPGELALVAARTSHGKTAVMLNLAWRWLRDPAAPPLLIYSAEEPVERLFWRLASLASVDINPNKAWTEGDLRNYARSPMALGESYRWPGRHEHHQEIVNRMRTLEAKLHFVWNTRWSAADIRADAMRWRDEHGQPAAVLVDYVQKLAPPPAIGKRATERRDIEMSLSARELKSLAVDLNCPVVSGAQLNRESIGRDQRKDLRKCASLDEAVLKLESCRPQLHHLREGGLEQEADAVLGLMNYAVDWQETLQPGANRKGLGSKQQPMDIGTLKNRYGRVGRWGRMAWTSCYGLLEDAEAEDGPEPTDFGDD
jgi:replicative DNA helicase